MQNNFLFFIFLILGLIGCSKKDLNMPQPSPMPIREVPHSEGSGCAIEFRQQLSLAEVALIAYEMQERCGYNKDQVHNAARSFTDRSANTR